MIWVSFMIISWKSVYCVLNVIILYSVAMLLMILTFHFRSQKSRSKSDSFESIQAFVLLLLLLLFRYQIAQIYIVFIVVLYDHWLFFAQQEFQYTDKRKYLIWNSEFDWSASNRYHADFAVYLFNMNKGEKK